MLKKGSNKSPRSGIKLRLDEYPLSDTMNLHYCFLESFIGTGRYSPLETWHEPICIGHTETHDFKLIVSRCLLPTIVTELQIKVRLTLLWVFEKRITWSVWRLVNQKAC